MKRNAIFAYWMRRELTEVGMNAINKEPERHEIEALLPWYAAGTLSRRDADRVEQALASDRELARRYDLVREELAETIHLNETLGAPSARAMEKLFAAIGAEEALAPRRRRKHISRTPSLATASILNQNTD
jgi:anti-sigma-K factor RskA